METILQRLAIPGRAKAMAKATIETKDSIRYDRFVDSMSPERERYAYDFGMCRHRDGWAQYDTDQDAWYFGIWVHLKERVIVTYAEGDESIQVFYTDAALKEMLERMGRVYGDPPPAFKVFDQLADGTWKQTNFYDLRPEVKS